MKLPNKIETERLIIYPMSLRFKHEIFENFTQEITKFMSLSVPKDISDTEAFINDAISNNKAGKNFQVFYTDKNDEFIGCGGLNNIDTDTPEFGVWVKKSAHGHKYGREAMLALKKWADANIQYKYLKYPVDKNNIASRKIPESMNGVIEDSYPYNTASGGTLDCIEFRIYRD
jgi:ribosomal-protein-alanine N-acetyltransferase